MLKTEKRITFTGNSTFDGVIAETYTATINSDNPADMTITSYQQNKAVYKENREQCWADRAEFENAAYAMQDEMIAALSAGETESLEERVSALEQQTVSNI